MSRTIRLVVEYDGTTLAGWQRQDNAASVQQHLESALTELLDSPTTVIGASRTDAGVHAEGQVCHFQTTHPSIPAHGIRKALNSALPSCIAVVDANEVDDQFHSRFQSSGKHYRYRILTRKSRSPLEHHRAWHTGYALDVARMREGARHLIGEHDFEAFRAAGCTARTATRRITSIDVHEPGPERVEVHVRGNAFLRKMVRIIVGTLVEVGAGRREPDEIAQLLAARDRTRSGKTAPPQGLTLVRVFYPPELP